MSRLGRSLLGIGALGALVAAFAWYDLSVTGAGPRDRFEPAEVARLETAMWRAYYEHRWTRLYFLSTTLIRVQHDVGPLSAHVAAWDATQAARRFRGGRNADDYRRALPALEAHYRRLATAAPAEVAERELAWWIVHRESGRGGPPPPLETLPGIAPHEPLVLAVADAAGAFYRLPAARFLPYARERARAMKQRDGFAAGGRALEEGDWALIQRTLVGAYQALRLALKP